MSTGTTPLWILPFKVNGMMLIRWWRILCGRPVMKWGIPCARTATRIPPPARCRKSTQTPVTIPDFDMIHWAGSTHVTNLATGSSPGANVRKAYHRTCGSLSTLRGRRRFMAESEPIEGRPASSTDVAGAIARGAISDPTPSGDEPEPQCISFVEEDEE